MKVGRPSVASPSATASDWIGPVCQLGLVRRLRRRKTTSSATAVTATRSPRTRLMLGRLPFAGVAVNVRAAVAALEPGDASSAEQPHNP